MKEKNTVCKEITKIASNTLTFATGAALLYAGYKYGMKQGARKALGLMKNWDPEQTNKFCDYVLEQNSKLVK